MKSVLTLLALVAICAMPAIGSAKKTPPPAPNLAASGTISVALRGEQVEPSPAIYDATVKLALSHSFTISAEQEAAMKTDTHVSMLFAEFNLGDDPKFQNGDKSATVNVDIPLGLIPDAPPVPCVVKLKWNKGKMSISVKGSLKLKDFEPNMVALKAKMEERAVQTFPIVTRLEFPGLPAYEVVAEMAADFEMTDTQGGKAEGLMYIEQSQSVKTKFFVQN